MGGIRFADQHIACRSDLAFFSDFPGTVLHVDPGLVDLLQHGVYTEDFIILSAPCITRFGISSDSFSPIFRLTNREYTVWEEDYWGPVK